MFLSPKTITLTLLSIFLLNVYAYAQSYSSIFNESSIHFDASLLHLGLAPKDFNSTSKRFTTRDNQWHYNEMIVLPELNGGYGYEIALGFQSAHKDTVIGWGIDLNYSVTNYNSVWNGIKFPVSNKEIWLVGKFGSGGPRGCAYFSVGIPLSSALTIKNGSFRMVNDQLTGEQGDATFHGGFPSIKFGLEIIYHIYSIISLDIGLNYYLITYTSVSSIMGENIEYTEGGITNIRDRLYSRGFSWRIGLRYDFRFF